MEQKRFHRWLHRLTVVTAAMIVPLVSVGGLVTTWDVGMADPEWPTPPWYLAWWIGTGRTLDRGIGYLVEHGHRQIGWIVGLLCIVQSVALWKVHGRRAVGWLGVATLMAVSVQGIFGGLRVRWISTELALVHGCLAHLVFAAAASLVLLTSRAWQEIGSLVALPNATRLWAVAATVVVYLQVVLGALVRHFGMSVYVHAAGALGVFVMLTHAVRQLREQSGDAAVTRTGRVLHVILGVQVLLGIATWGTTNGFGPHALTAPSAGQAFLATAHVAVGAITFAATLALTMLAMRHPVQLAAATAALPQAEAVV
jgi:cytochrome c oxidase assembly protein subunit 15